MKPHKNKKGKLTNPFKPAIFHIDFTPPSILSADGNFEKMVIRTCALDSGTLTLDTELVRMSHCGSFVLDGRSSSLSFPYTRSILLYSNIVYCTPIYRVKCVLLTERVTSFPPPLAPLKKKSETFSQCNRLHCDESTIFPASDSSCGKRSCVSSAKIEDTRNRNGWGVYIYIEQQQRRV
jgi:hypothetical protein